MYDKNYLCRYHKDDIFLDTDDVSEEEKDYIRDILYKEDLLFIFNMTENDNYDDVMTELYQSLSTCTELKELMRRAASTFISEDEILGLCILYSYDYMYLTHKCISSYLDNGIIAETDLALLKDKVCS